MKYNLNQISEIYHLPITTLILKAQEAHHKYQEPDGIMLSSSKSIKTGGCPEDCAYCPQSAHYKTFVEKTDLLSEEVILAYAKESLENGAIRMCIGSAWGNVPTRGDSFDKIIDLIGKIQAMGLEVCCSIGTMNDAQLDALKAAKCGSVNYNLDSSKEFYSKIITTRTYEERFNNLKKIQSKGLKICCGGILGMGETVEDRLSFLCELANLDPQPEAIPVNALVPIKGTPLEGQERVDSIEYVRFIATARIFMPKSFIAIAAGRLNMSEEMQTLCFLAGANSFYIGEKILTTNNSNIDEDRKLIKKLGLRRLVA